MYLRKAITLQTITWTLENDLHKLSDTQSILMYHSVVKVKKLRASVLGVPGFLKSLLCGCVCVSAPEAMNN